MLARVLLVLTSLALTGCLRPVEIPPVVLSGPSGGYDALPESLGVVELADLRPREQRRGKKPWLIPLILWNQRMGRYVTSESHFGGDVTGDVSHAIAVALSGWRFGRGRVLEAEADATPADLCQRSDLEYVVSGEIHHLYGAVRQRAWLFIIPTPWVQGVLSGNEVGDPVGVVRLSLRIHECRSSDEIVAQDFTSEGLFPRLSPSAAVQRAFDDLIRDVERLSRGASEPTRSADAFEGEAPVPEPDATPPSPPPEQEQPESGETELVPL